MIHSGVFRGQGASGRPRHNEKEGMTMIKLTRLDGHKLLINEAYIEIVEETPDTVISFQNGHKLLVRESISTILDKIRLQSRRGRD